MSQKNHLEVIALMRVILTPDQKERKEKGIDVINFERRKVKHFWDDVTA